MSHAATGKAAHRKRGYIQRNLRRNWPLYTMVLPAVVLIFIFSYIPMYGIVMAFQQFKPSLGFFHSAWARPLYRYFEQVITDPYFARVFRNTVVLGVLNLLWSFPAPILLALLFNEMRSPRFKKITQTISYLPYFISTVVVIGMMKLLFQDNGPIASVLRNMGFDWTNPFMLPSAFRTLYIGSSLWTGVGYNSIIYLAAISGISQDLYESAVIDGASRFQQAVHITLPSLVPTITILFIFAIPGVVGSDSSKILLMYNEATYATADVLGTYTYRKGIQGNSYSYSA
ncbi:MAG: sugar ABC transporter permease, partial [Clostridiales bacterium]|nr:sugar ABC transporter permease [Clostridiales bacterium]